jgi:pimeloyl-ACP methyl ester carboxylesterase
MLRSVGWSPRVARGTLAAIALLALGTPVRGDTAARAAEDRYFDAGGVSIHYTVAGRGEPILVLHGFGDNVRGMLWRSVVEPLAKDYRVIAFDSRGHGLSGKPHDPKQYGLECVEDAVRLLDHLKISKAHVIGYSMGGGTALKLATTHPERVASLTAVAAGVLLASSDDLKQLIDRLADDLDQGKGITRLIEYMTPPGRPKPTAEQLTTPNLMFNLTHDTKALACAVRGWKACALPEDALRANTVPALAVVGDQDVFKAGVDVLKARMAGLEAVVVAGANHGSLLGRPEFHKALRAFLARHTAAKEPAAAGPAGR